MEDLKFEKALERLEKIVEDLESGNMPLEDALKKYEEGVKLSRLCAQKLAQTESKIEVLTQTLSKVQETEISGVVDASEKKNRKKAKKKNEKSSDVEDDILL